MSTDTPQPKIGVLAYGSLIGDPGPEIGPCIVSTLKNVETPFSVEYARSSRSRGGGPSLIPVDAGGAKVLGVIHVLKDDITVEQGKDWVWRREVRKYSANAHYVPKLKPDVNDVVVDVLSNFCGVRTVLYTRIGINISPLNGEELARLAVKSAKKTVKPGMDGISYLLNAKRQGIITPLTEAYERAVLRLTDSPDLDSALERARAMGNGTTVAATDSIPRGRTSVPDDIQIYCNCMERVRHHVSVADTVFAGKIDTGHRDLNAELTSLHLRKALEEIAFSSLSANREKYSATRAGFATEWNARRMLGFVEKVNPKFYPVPLKPPLEIAPGRKFFDRVADGFLTKEDFATLYDGSAEVLHCRNPYAPGDPAICVKYAVDEWSRRIKALLSWHLVQLLDVDGIWIFQVPNEGRVRAFPAIADGPFVVEP